MENNRQILFTEFPLKIYRPNLPPTTNVTAAVFKPFEVVHLSFILSENAWYLPRNVKHREWVRGPNNRMKNLSNTVRSQIVEDILKSAKKGVPHKGDILKTAGKFNVCRKTAGQLWKRAREQLESGLPIEVSSLKKGNCGRKPKIFDKERFENLRLHDRTTMRSVGENMELCLGTLQRFLKEKQLKRHSSSLKPFLNDATKKRRLEFCLSKLQLNSDHPEENPCFEPFYNSVHIDGKWFYLTNDAKTFYLLDGEDEPQRTCKSKRFISKVMFMAAVARPRFAPDGTVLFNGKIGIFPLVRMEPAERNSKNRPAGTLEMKPIESVNKEVIKNCLIEEILPAVKKVWPSGASHRIYIQQDNARPHLSPGDDDWIQAATDSEWDIKIQYQPANSPDLNIHDLGFFSSIQSLKNKSNPRSVEELVTSVLNAFHAIDPHTLNSVWLSYQMCMIEILKVQGGNSYRLQHMGKARLLCQGALPTTLSVDRDLVEEAQDVLNRMDEFGAIAAPHLPDLNL